MTLLIGIDEAGYGPNLGPLVVAATAWDVEEKKPGTTDLYERLARVVSRAPEEERLAIADSKELYQPAGGLLRLERAVHATLAACGQNVASWSTLLDTLFADTRGFRHDLAWQRSVDYRLPLEISRAEVSHLGQCLLQACQRAAVRPIAMQARLVFPRQFNELTVCHDSKGAALSHTTLALLRDLLTEGACACSYPQARVVCDKHGARNRYGALLATHFPNEKIETLVESREESRYRWGKSKSGLEICFRVRGESFLPTALASMTAKYLRELAMKNFNQFWQKKIPGIRPTAGYPQDAKRFREEIHSMEKKLKIPDNDLWRNR